MVGRWSWAAAGVLCLVLLGGPFAALDLAPREGAPGTADATAVPGASAANAAPAWHAPTQAATPGPAGSIPAAATPVAASDLPAAWRFEPYAGPDAAARFVAWTADGAALLYDDAIVPVAAPAHALTFDGVLPTTPHGEGRLAARSAHYIGADPAAWRTDVPQFAAIRYEAMWPGVDLVVRFAPDGSLEFDHEVAPGADAAAIALRTSGAAAQPGPQVHPDGSVAFGTVRLAAPVSYTADGTPVASWFEARADGAIGYGLGPRDATQLLTIDPVMRFGTYRGTAGDQSDNDIQAIAHPFDPFLLRIVTVGTADDAAYATGFPLTTTHGAAAAGTVMALSAYDYDPVAKTTAAVATIHIGGSGTDAAKFVAGAPANRIVLLGETTSANMPVLAPLKADLGTTPATYDGALLQGGRDMFVARLTPGFTLEFASYVGSVLDDTASGLAVDTGGRIGVVGHGPGANFPTKLAWSSTPNGADDVLLAVINAGVSPAVLETGTYIGDGEADQAGGLWMNNANIWVAGTHTTLTTASGTMATGGAYQNFEPPGPQSSAFAFRMARANPGFLAWYSYLSGSGDEVATGIHVQGDGTIWVTGTTTSDDFLTCNNPTPPPERNPPPPDPPAPQPPPFDNPCVTPVLQPGYSGGPEPDAFVTQFDAAGSQLLYSTYWGTTGTTESPTDILVEPVRSHVVVLGLADGALPAAPPATVAPLQGGLNGAEDPFLLRFLPGATPAVPFLSTPLGSATADVAGRLATDALANLYVSGSSGTGYPTSAGSVQPIDAGGMDGTAAIIGAIPPSATIRAKYGVDPPLASTVDSPTPVAALPVFARATGDPVSFDIVGSTKGDFDLKASNHRWTLYDADGITVVQTATGGATPSFNPVNLLSPGERIACVDVRDDGPVWHPDGGDLACIRVTWTGSGVSGFTLESASFIDGATIPSPHTCYGANTSPPLHFANIPAGTVRLALVAEDVTNAGFVHWLWWDLPASQTDLPGNVALTSYGGIDGRNGYGINGYRGPCPSDGEHTYRFTAVALAQPLGLPIGSDIDQAIAAMDGKVIALAELTGVRKAPAGFGGGGAPPPPDPAEDDYDLTPPADTPPTPAGETPGEDAGEPAPTGPVAYAGPDLTAGAGQAVTLDGSRSPGAVSWTWTQLSGAPVDLEDLGRGRVRFVAADGGASPLAFRLTTKDASGATHVDDVTVTVVPDLAIQADPAEALAVDLRSNQDGIVHHWDFGDGSAGSSEEQPRHRYPAAGTYNVTLTVIADGFLSTAQKQVTVGDDGRSVPDAGCGADCTVVAGTTFPAWALLALIPGVALIVAAVLLLRRRRRPSDADTVGMEPATAPPGTPPGP